MSHPSSASCGDMMVSVPSQKRACDQCHSVKEKCRRPNASASCERCFRLGQTCQTRRHPAKKGRRSRGSGILSYTLPDSNSTECGYKSFSPSELLYNARLTSNPALFPDLDQWECHFLNLLKDALAPSPLDKFLVVPSFRESHHCSFVQNLVQPIPVLRNAAVACAAAFFSDEFEFDGKNVDIGHRRAALAVSSLRSLEICNDQDVATALILGVAMVTFAMHHADGQPFLISHYTLNLIKPQYTDMPPLNPTMMDFLRCLIATETFECLLYSATPTIKIGSDERTHFVDRYLGLSSSILAHFYDICEISHQLRHSRTTAQTEITTRLDAIKTAVEQWSPLPPTKPLERFTAVETAGIMSQAKIFRLAGLLIIHRLRHPFGTEDEVAILLSKEIISEFELVFQMAQRSVPCTALAYLAACFEITGSEARRCALDRSGDNITFSKQAHVRFKSIMGLVWNARDRGRLMYWFELGNVLGDREKF